MEIKELLPIGSVVLLKEGQKRLMVIGVKQTDTENDIDYDYLSVIYPEGFIGDDNLFFFNHDAIEEIVFKGYADEEREKFIKKLTEFYNNN